MSETQNAELIELKEHLRFSQTVFEIASSFVSLKSSDETIGLALEKLGLACRAGRSYLFVFREDRELMDNTHEWCAPGVEPQKDNLQGLPIAVFPWWFEKLARREPIHVDDVGSMPPEAAAERAILEEQDIRSILVLPVFIGGELMGFVGLDNVWTPGTWSPESMGYLEVASEIMGSALTRERNQQLLESRNRELAEVNFHLEQTRDQLIQSEKMAAVGHLASGVAHEINNPAGFIGTNLHTLREYLDVFKEVTSRAGHLAREARSMESEEILASTDDLGRFMEQEDFEFVRDDAVQLTDESITGIERIRTIVGNLTAFAGSAHQDVQTGNVNTAIRDALERSADHFSDEILVHATLGLLKDMPCRMEELTQMFVHLLTNAAQAMPDGGTLRITSETDVDRVTVSVCDTGQGIEPQARQTLFNPFFSTRDVNAGQGLGLAIVHTIVRNHGGKIEVESDPGHGSCFRIHLPFVRSQEDGER